MDEGIYTLKEFFAARSKFGSPEIKSRIEKSEHMAPLRERVLNTLGKPGWPMALDEIYKKTADLLDIGVLDLLLAGWDTYQGLKKYTDKNKYSPTQTILVPLAEHTITSEHHPSINVLINDDPAGTITFQITLRFTVRGVILLLQDAKIKGVKTGEIKGKGSLKCEGALLLEQDFHPIPLPASVDLGDGIPISA